MSSYSERMWTSLGYRGGAPGPDDVLGLSFREIVHLPQCVSPPPPRAPVSDDFDPRVEASPPVL